ncbi:hypothetical protein [Kurthia sibirica]|uniref:Uncharacterized protein n=1 Tax=Kurthia sibirica TaxID=202750 RepID=A0A2U3APA4_9BACL|nr:hypothetical protein [Kurthia sibirica]PWI26339.1 hypothetical protein DEX24_03105 [Kurthia sibirica]GEK34839.1 hypothetical protein KSI01_23720 [Kurthia sibirica]
MNYDAITDIKKIEGNKVQLSEINESVNYSTALRIASNKQTDLYLIDLPIVKSKSLYLTDEKRKDCDFVIMDILRKKVYFIELKSSTDAASSKHINEQLLCGEFWWKHLAFCMKIDSNEYDGVKLVIYVNSKNKRNFGKVDLNEQYGFYRGYGKNVFID